MTVKKATKAKNKKLIPDFLISPPKPGDLVKGKIIGVGRSAVYIDLGPLGVGVILGREFQKGKDQLKNLEIGDEIDAKVVEPKNEDGYVELSVSEATAQMNWEKIKQIKEDKEIIAVKITGANKGGLLTKVLDIQAFIPVSQLSVEHYPRVKGADKNKILEELQKFIGEELEVRILSLSSKDKKIILSEKEKEVNEINKALEKYKVGDIVEGVITGITDFGVFIKFDPKLEGLIHISELDWKIIDDPADVVKVGEKIKAKIVEISEGRVSLSLKATKKNPWENIEKKYRKGDKIKGKVIKFNSFGAFVQISPEIQGLCHISEFGSREKMEKVLEEGKEYNFKILLVDPKQHKISLSLIK